MATDNVHDVLIIGAGPAGTAAAIHGRMAGLDTVVVEKSHFPRFRIGESLLPNGNELLRELGVWETINRAGFIKKFGARFYTGEGETEKKVVFADGLVPGLGQTYQVERARFDSLLLERARQLGARIHIGATARALRETPDSCIVQLDRAPNNQASPIPETIRARYVIDATGRDTFFPTELKARTEPTGLQRRIAIYNHFCGIPREQGASAGDTIIVRLPEGWFWIIPIDEARSSVGLVTINAAFKSAQLSPAAYFDAVVTRTPRLRHLLSKADPQLDYHVTADYSYLRQRVAGGRMVLAGDTGGFLDPIFSSGVYLALRSARHAAALVIRASRENRAFKTSECSRLLRETRRPAAIFHRLIDAFYDDHSFSVFMCPRPPWGLAPAITSIVAGHADLSFGMRCRFHLFLLVCRLQRHFPMVPPISLAPASTAQ